jgi:hypothetical protein
MIVDVRRLLLGLAGLAIILLVNHFVFHQRPIPNLQIVLTYVAIAFVYFIGAFFQRRRGRVVEGWHYLTPGPMEWFCLVGGTAFSLLLLYIYHFVGSARADAAFQMQVLKWLVIAFSSGTVLVGFFSFVMSTRWNDEQIERRIPFFPPRTILLRNIVAIGHEAWSDCVLLIDAAGQRLRISPYQHGAEALVRKIVGEEEEAEPTA